MIPLQGLFRRGNEGVDSLIALVAFADSAPPSLEAMWKKLGAYFHDTATLELDYAADALKVRIEDQELQIGAQEQPIPWRKLERLAEDAWYWPQALEKLRPHQSTVALVLANGPGSPVHRSMLVTRVAALIGEAFGYIGVYWDPATMIHSAQSFSESAREMNPKQLPLRLWVNFRSIRHQDDTQSLFTDGLESLGLREIEVCASRATPEDINEWAYNIANYQLVQNIEIEHGQAVGKTPQNWVRVYHVPSALDPNRTVLTLDFEEGLDEE